MKKIYAVVMSAVLLLGALCFAGCDGNADEMKNLQEQVTDQTDLLQRLEAKLSEQTEQLEKLKKENQELAELLNNIGTQLAEGHFYTLAEAYESGLLSEQHLMSIAYYNNQGRTGNEAIMDESYQPMKKRPEELSNIADLTIRRTYWKKYFGINNEEEISVDDIAINPYLGMYNNCIAIMIWVDGGAYGDAVGDDVIGGVHFFYPNTNRILVWRNEK